MSIKKQLLDPLGTICKLVALNFSELNTKISIHNHVLSLQKPNSYQSFVRKVYGDSKENLSELFYVFVRVIKWYLVNETSEESEQNWYQIYISEEIKRMTKYACFALRKLQETYEYGNVVLTIQFYINILEDAVNGTYSEIKLPNYIIEKEAEFKNLLDYEKLKNFWDYKKLKKICELYDDCFTIYNDPEISDNQKEALIDGSLRSINAILDLIDNDFQKLISNSNRG